MSDLNPEVVIDGQRAVRTATPDAVTQKNDKIAFSIVDGQLCLIVSDVNGGGGDVLRYKGSVATYSDLPNDAETGDVYNVLSDGKNYAWTGTEWDDFGGTITVSLAACTDVDLNNPANGEVLIYNSTQQRWENGSGGFLYNTSNDTNALGVGTSSSANANSTAVGIGANANGSSGNNTAVGYGATANSTSCVAVGDSSSAKNGSVAVGSNAVAGTSSATGCTAIGSSSSTSGTDSTAIGYNSSANGGVTVGARAQSDATGVAIGKEAKANGVGRIQIGAYGTNNTDNTMNVALAYDLNVQLLDATGEIPTARYKAFTGTDGVNAGAKGCVPAPTASDADKFLKSDGTWETVSGGASSLTDIAQAGSNIAFSPAAYGVTNVGGVTLTSGVASGFGNSAYLEATVPNESGVTYYFKVNTGARDRTGVIVEIGDDLGIKLVDRGGGNYSFDFKRPDDKTYQQGDSWMQQNTDLWFKIEITSSTILYWSSYDGSSYSQTGYSYTPTGNQELMRLGQTTGTFVSNEYFPGSIDLNACYGEKNSVDVWRGYDASNTKTIISSPEALTNLATGSHALSVGSISTSNNNWATTTFGDLCRPSGSALTLIGYKAEAYNGPSAAVVVGCDSKVRATGSIHLGCYGENNVAGTFTVSLSTDGNWQNTNTYTLCDANGNIPAERLGALPASDGTYIPVLTITSGVPTIAWVAYSP